MRVVIAKVDEVLFDGEADSLTVPGSAGQMKILAHHEALITTLKAGTATVPESKTSDPKTFPILRSVLQLHKNSATVLW